MKYENTQGNFYHDGNKQIIGDAVIRIGEAELLYREERPTDETKAPAGSLCICVANGVVSLFQNTGTKEAPTWAQFINS